MPTPVLMPALSPTMTEGTLAKWLKKEGDMVKSGDVIAEIETDKATMEVESADEGRLGKILVPAGTAGVKVNAAIAVLIDKNEKVGDIIVPSPSQGGNTIPLSPPQGEGARIPSSSQGEGARIPFPPEGEGTRIPSPFQGEGRVGDKNVSAPNPLSAPSLSGGGGHVALGSSSSTARIIASPLAKRVANERGVDLRTITGTGPRGRIIKADVMGATPHPNPLATSGERGQTARASSTDARALADAYGMTYTAQPNSSVRKVIAARLSESKQTIPHFYLTTDCVIDKLLDARAHLNDRAKGAYKLSVNDFIIRAAALALRDFPAANVAWTDAATLQFDHADISVAVATPNGLITPIVKAAETKSIVQISTEIKDLAARARDGALKPTEFQGGTFTISNLGMYGISEFSAIINPPQACILAVGAGVQQPVVEGGAVVVRTVMKVTLSVDHRAVDGAVGAEFLQILKQYIENPVGMLV